MIRSRAWAYVKDVRAPIYIFLLTRLLIVSAVYFGVVVLTKLGIPYEKGAFANDVILDPWARWDAGHYAGIVTSG